MKPLVKEFGGLFTIGYSRAQRKLDGVIKLLDILHMVVPNRA